MTLTRMLQRGARPARHAVAAAAALALLVGGGAAQAAADSKASRYYEDALTRYERKDIDGAIIQLKNALQIDQNMLPVQVLLAKALLQNGQVGAAEAAINEALRLGVNRAEVVLLLAQAMIGQGKQKQLFDQPQFALAGLPPGIQQQLQLLRAAAANDLGDPRTALKSIDEARALDPKSADSWVAEVPIRIRTRQFKEALEAADRALAMAPNSAEAWYQKGSVLHVQGDLRGALAAYTKAVQINPDHLESRITRGGLYLDLNQAADAAKDVAEAQRIQPIDPRAAYLRALLAERNKETNAARAALREVTEFLDPVPLDFIRYRPQMLMLNGMAHYGLNEREKAKPYLEVFQRAHGSSPASKLLAQILLSEGNVGRGTEVLETYLKAQPGDYQALTLLASALVAQGRHARATALMQEALKTRDAPELRTALGLSLIGGGQMGNAATELEAAFKKDPTQLRAGMALVGLYLRNNQAGKAVTIAEALVKQDTGNPTFQNLLGMSLAQSGKVPEARNAFERALKLDDGLLNAKLNLARLDIASKTYDSAEQRLAAILKIDEKNNDALYEMALLANQRGQYADAQRWLEKANDVAGPKELRPGLALVDLHLSGRRPAPALEIAKRLVAKVPDDLSALIALARAQLANADAAGAKTTLSNATRYADFNAQVQVQIAQLQLSAGNPTGAAYSLEKALGGTPDYLPALVLAAQVDLQQGDAAKAEKRAREIAERNPKRAVGYSLLGDVALARNQVPAALDAYRRAHQIEPGAESLMKLYRASWSQDNGKASQQLADQWLKSHPQDMTVRKAQADGFARQGNFAQARTAYESLAKTAPKDVEVLNNLANVLVLLKDASATQIAEQALALNPTNANLIDTLGWTLFQQGHNDRALQLLRDARLRDPNNPDIRYHLATVLAKTGRRTEAKEEIDAALRISRTFDGAGDAQTLQRSLQ